MNSTLSKSEIAVVNYNKKALSLPKSQKSEILTWFLKAEQLLHSYPSPKLQYLTYNNLACYYEGEKEYTKAIQYLSHCQKLKSSDKSCRILSIGALLNLASVLSKLNRHEESLNSLDKVQSLLEVFPNPCLKVVYLYTVGLEYEHLFNFSYSYKFYLDSRELAAKVFGLDHGVLRLIDKGIKNVACKQEDPICILRDKTAKNSTTMRGRRSVEKKRSRGDTQNGGYYIKVDTTPWLEMEQWRVKSSSETPKMPTVHNLRKKFTRLSQEVNKSSLVPLKLEEKLDFIGNKLSNLSGKLFDIEKLFKQETPKPGFLCLGKQEAALKIQKAFRGFIRRKRAKRHLKVLPFFMISRDTEKKEKFIQTSRNTSRPKVKGLLQSIIFIQKWLRGFLARSQLKAKTASAIKIQKTFRMYQVKKLFKSVKQAIVHIQQSYRIHFLKKNCKKVI